tara:strand:- start:3362 stop:3595 length:234 start_codon:yes stop_codon:yes gene_type:complete
VLGYPYQPITYSKTDLTRGTLDNISEYKIMNINLNRLREEMRVDMIQSNPELSHEEIVEVLDEVFNVGKDYIDNLTK